jgi:hypothetical protein
MESSQPIHTLEQARAYYEAMNCSLFHIYREDSARTDEFSALNISEALLESWRHDYAENRLTNLTRGDAPPDKLWSLHCDLADVVCSLSSPCLIERFYEASCSLASKLPRFDKLLVAETLVGRSAIANKTGLIFRCHQLGRPDQAQSFVDLVRTLVSEPFPAHEVSQFGGEPVENRRLSLLANLEAVLQSCKKRIWNLPWALTQKLTRRR